MSKKRCFRIVVRFLHDNSGASDRDKGGFGLIIEGMGRCRSYLNMELIQYLNGDTKIRKVA